MAKLSILAGATSQSVTVFIQDSSVTTGIGLPGLVFNTANLIAYYAFTGANGGSNLITLLTLAAANSAYSSGGFKEIDATNMKGMYRLDIPNAAIAASKGRSSVIMLSGAANMVPCVLEIELTGWDNQDAVHGGLSALPNATAGASTGLLISGTNSGTTTFGAITCTGSFNISDGLLVSRSTANSPAATFTGTGSGNGVTITGGAAITTTAAGNGLVIAGGASSTGVGGVAGQGVTITGGAGSASQNGAAIGATIAGGGTNTVASTANGLAITGTSTGNGLVCGSGAGATGDGLQATSNATNGNGVSWAGKGSGQGVLSTGGATGNAEKWVGGATSGAGLLVTTTSGDGMTITPTVGNGITVTANGTSKHGIVSTGGTAGTSDGIKAVAGTGGVDLRANITGNLTGSVTSVSNSVMQSGTAQAGSTNTITLSAGASATNGLYDPGLIKINSGTGAGQVRTIIDYVGSTKVATIDRDWRTAPDSTSVYDILPASNLFSTNEGLAQGGGATSITLNSSASAVDSTYVGQVVTLRTGTGQDQNRLVTAYNGTTKVATVDAAWATNPDSTSGYIVYQQSRLDATISSRMATYTQPTGFLAASFPTSVASPTNITAGTITTTTNLTNAPTAGDFTAAMKTSLNAATPSVTVSDKTGFSLTSPYDFSKGTVAMTESYPVLGATVTPVQALYDIMQHLNQMGISGTTMTLLKRDQATTAKTFTLDSATSPTTITEAS